MPAKRRTVQRRGWRVLLAVAIPIALGLGGWLVHARFDRRPTDTLASIRAAAGAGRFAEADGRLVRWIDENPADSEAWLMRGMVLASLGKTDAAIAAFQSVSESSPQRKYALTFIGDMGLSAHRADQAEGALREAAERDHNAVEPRLKLIQLFSLQQRHAEVRDRLWELFQITREPRHLNQLIQNQFAYENDARSFTAEIDEFLKVSPGEPYFNRIKGLELMMRGHPSEAMPYLQVAADALSNDPMGRFALAECLMALGQFQGDESILGQKPDSPADVARWYVLRGRLQESLGKSGQALESLQSAVKTNPLDAEAGYRYGQLLLRQGRAVEAKATLEKASALKASQTEFRGEFDRLIRKAKEGEASYEQIGKLCRESGFLAEARAWYQLAESAEPNNPSVRTALAEFPQGAIDAAVALTRPIRKLDSPLQLDTLAKPRLASALPPERLRLEDVSSAVGINYQYDSAAKGDLYLGDTMGGGVAMFDFDGDGWLDLYFVNGCPLPYDPKSPPGRNKFYRNRRDGTFEDITERARAPGRGYGMGCAVGDYDGDGHDDLFLTGLDQTVLYRNKGDGTFEDVTARAKVQSNRWTTAAGFADLDRDGDLDLMVVTYVSADPRKVPDCRDPTGRPLHCSPARFDAQADLLFRNNGDGTFTNVSVESGIDAAPNGRGLGMAIADLDGDGLLDIFVANDLSPDFLFLNRGNLRFEESALSAGVAFNGSGRATASMGVVADDLNGDGLTDIFVANFLNEPDTLFQNVGNGLFIDATLSANLQAPGPIGTGFGVAVPDFDNDGYPDLFMSNGHVDDQPWINTPIAQRPQAFLGEKGGRFTPVEDSSLAYLKRNVVGRGLAAGDLDNDGRVDVVVVHRDVPAVVLKNSTKGGHWVGIKLRGARTGSMPVGTRVTCRAGGREQVRVLSSGTSYLAVHDPRIWFGLGASEKIDSIQVRWPSGMEQTFTNLPIERIIELKEGNSAPTIEPLKR